MTPDIKAIRRADQYAKDQKWTQHVVQTGVVSALCDEVDRLQQQLAIYEKHGVTCQTFGHKLTGCAECNRDDDADDAMALDTMKLQARQYFELLPEVERLRKDAARYQWLVAYFVSDSTNFDDAIVDASEVGTEQVTAVIDAAMEAKP